MLNIDNYSISPLKSKPDSQDYEKLREAGISHIQEFASKLWTDFNIHDPGVTILELLCYAITDLGYRTNFDIKDILTKPGASGPEYKDTFFSAKEILTCHPVTVNDYRKLILDEVPEIKNIWFIPVIKKVYEPYIYISNDYSSLVLDADYGNNPLSLKGLYNIKYELYEDELYTDYEIEKKINTDENLLLKKDFYAVRNETHLMIKNKIQCVYLKNRNLCEDMQCINPVDYEYVGICADIELKKDADPIEVKKEVYRTINEYISPQLRFYTIEELLDKGKTIEEIFQGSAAKSGFVDYDELEKFQRKEVLYTSDIINLLIDLPGIANIKKLHFSSYRLSDDKSKIDTDNPLSEGEEYCLHLKKNDNAFKFRLDILEESRNRVNKIKFFYDSLNIAVTINEGKVKLNEIAPVLKRPFNFADDLPQPKGKHRDLEKYYSIQNEFPVTYSLGKEGISESAPKLRKSQRLQLKGYLIFFEQLLADYLTQLFGASQQLSFSDFVDRQDYFFQKLSGDEIIDFEMLKKENFDSLFQEDAGSLKYLSEIIYNKHNAEEKIFNRRNRFLDMLIARFNDAFVELSISQFIRQSTNEEEKYEQKEIIEDKKSFLKAYPKIRGKRLHAFNYNRSVCNTTNISGYEFLMLKKLGISNKYNLNPNPETIADPNKMLAHCLIHPVFIVDSSGYVNLAKPPVFHDNRQARYDYSFGFHIIEHTLLRPRWGSDEKLLNICADEFEEDCPCNDPYSFKITAVMPGWLNVFLNMNFRRYVETLMREELPAHISIKICWVSPEQMHQFEKSYFAFTDCLRKFSEENSCYENLQEPIPNKYMHSLNELVDVINDLNNVYPPSYLVDCNGIEIKNKEILKHPIILGQSALNEFRSKTSIWAPQKLSGKDIFTDKDQLEKERIYFINKGSCGDTSAVFKKTEVKGNKK